MKIHHPGRPKKFLEREARFYVVLGTVPETRRLISHVDVHLACSSTHRIDSGFYLSSDLVFEKKAKAPVGT
jgi:hypothetical protein